MNKKYRRRILFFLFVPILTSVIIASNGYFIIQVISGVILTLYVGFIIFLRDSMRAEEFDKIEERLKETELSPAGAPSQTSQNENANQYVFGDEGGFEIVGKGSQKIGADADFFEGSEITDETIKEYNAIISDKIDEKDTNEFRTILRLILRAIKESLTTTSAMFFIYDPEKEKITLHVAESDVPKNEIIERKFDLENDVISKIASTKEPRILSNISPNVETDNLRYYLHPQGIKSFCGVPYDYNNQLTFILAVDSKGGNDFGTETIYVLGRYVRIISMLISLFEENHSKKMNDSRLKALLSLISVDKSFETIDEIAGFFARISEELIQWDFFTFSIYNASDDAFKILKSKTKNIPTKFVREGFKISMKESLTGEAVRRGEHIYAADVKAKNLPRFSPNDNITSDGAFLAVPLVFEGQNYGVVTFETLKKNSYGADDISFIKKAVKIFTYYVYSFANTVRLKSLMSLDPQTKTLTKKEFLNRFNDVLRKEKACNKSGVLALIKIDSPEENQTLFNNSLSSVSIKKMAELIKMEIKKDAIIGRVGISSFAVHFFDATSNDIRIWAEKLRKKIAQETFDEMGVTRRYTISVGLASTKGKTNPEEIFSDAGDALEKAVKSGGNKIVE